MTEMPGIRETWPTPKAPSTPSSHWPKPAACWDPARAHPAHRHGLLPAALRQGLRRRRRTFAHPALRTDGALLLEVFTHDGVGTMVVDEKLESLREATSDDVGGILQLIEPFERDGTLVRRERTEIERDIANYTVIEHDGIIFGCAALYPYPEARTAEMAALTVSPLSQSQGDGERMLKRIEHRAKGMGLDSIFVLTTRTMHWFIKRGFTPVDPEWLPEARKRKYNWDRRSQVLVKKFN
jgi:amino-acid N-acetyltransferase